MIGKRLAEIRNEHGMTQPELAEILSVSIATVSGYEHEHTCPSDESKVKIAKYFDISLDYLLGAVDEKRHLNRENVIVLEDDINSETREHINRYVLYSVHLQKEDEVRKVKEEKKPKK